MSECEVYFTDYAKKLMRQRNCTVDDETLIAAIVGSDPLGGEAVFSGSGCLRRRGYPTISARKPLNVFYAYFPNADIQLNATDVAIVISVDDPNSPSGQGLEPDSVVRILEMIAELTRYVFG